MRIYNTITWVINDRTELFHFLQVLQRAFVLKKKLNKQKMYFVIVCDDNVIIVLIILVVSEMLMILFVTG